MSNSRTSVRHPRLAQAGSVVALALLGFLIVSIGSVVSRFVPGLPTSTALEIIERAARGEAEAIPDALAARALEGNRWYQVAVLPGLAGLLAGAVVARFRPLRAIELAGATALFALMLLLGEGVAPFAQAPRWLGIVLFAASARGLARGTESSGALSRAT